MVYANKEKEKETRRRYYQTKKEKIKEWQRRYEKSNKGKQRRLKYMKSYMMIYRERHPEKAEEWERRNRKRKKENLLTLKVEHGGKCKLCGYNKYIGALEFHHTRDKQFNIGHKFHYGIQKLRAEAEKCILLCSNCHREVEAGIIKVPTRIS